MSLRCGGKWRGDCEGLGMRSNQFEFDPPRRPLRRMLLNHNPHMPAKPRTGRNELLGGDAIQLAAKEQPYLSGGFCKKLLTHFVF